LDNLAVARILREIADLLEIKNDNPFKIRAYRNAATSSQTIPIIWLARRGGIARDSGNRERPCRAYSRNRRHRRRGVTTASS